jgi:hypothetical protein
MRFKTYVCTPDGRYGALRYFNKAASVVARAKFLRQHNPSTHCIVVERRADQKFFFLGGWGGPVPLPV